MRRRIILSIAAAAVSCHVYATDWTYDSGTGKITDGDWAFAAADDGNGNIVINAHTDVYPALAGDLDFTKPVKDSANNSYTIVKLNTQFNNDAAGKKIARLLLPASGLTEIGDNAFRQCTAITNIVNFLPDSVTKVGKYSFYKCTARQTLFVKGIARFGTNVGGNNKFSECAFNSSSITRIVFGPDLKEIFDWDNGPFSYCTSLTNVTFDAGMSGAKFSGARNGGFYGCTALAGTIDLSGFSDLSYVGTVGGSGRALGNTAIKKVIVGPGLTKLDYRFFDQMASLQEVVFNTSPVNFTWSHGVDYTLFGGLPATQAVIARVRAEDKEAWATYSATGEINPDDSTFLQTIAGDNYRIRFLLSDEESHYVGNLGEWIYDLDAGVVSNEFWTFNASGLVQALNVGPCIRYPDAAKVLDFSASLTDTQGRPGAFVVLNTALGTGNTNPTDAGTAVADLRFGDGLLTVGAAAFSRLDNCTNVVNYLPDSVTRIGSYAFYKLKVATPLKLKGIVNLGDSKDKVLQAFGSSGVTQVTFGPGFKQIYSWANGAFSGCSLLTNVTFDAATTGAMFGGIRTDAFYGCSALTGTIDLSGFSNLAYVSDEGGAKNPLSGTGVKEIVIGENCQYLGAGFFNGMGSLEKVTFRGPPPDEIIFSVNKTSPRNVLTASTLFNSANMTSRTITTCISRKYKADWLPYSTGTTVDDLKKRRGATWKAEYVTSGIDLALRPFMVVDDAPQMVIMFR